MKRAVCSLLLLSLLLSSVLCLTACNTVQPGKLSAIVGVYEMDKYEVTPTYDKDGNKLTGDAAKTVDKLEEYGMKVYVVITESGYGYYAYEDKDTPLTVTEMKQVYEYDSDNPELIREVTLYDGEYDSHTFYVQSRRHTLTDNTGAWNLNLKIGKSTVPVGERNKINVHYKRVSRKGTLAALEKELGTTVTPQKFADTYFRGILAGGTSVDGADVTLYDYYAVDTATMTATRYYALRADNVERTESVTLAYDVTANTLKIGEVTYSSYVNDNTFSFNITEGNTYKTVYRSYLTTLAEMQEDIAAKIAAATANP